jgi:hypothetical protein
MRGRRHLDFRTHQRNHEGMENPVTTPGLIAPNLLDVLGNSEAGELELQFSQFKESLAPGACRSSGPIRMC